MVNISVDNVIEFHAKGDRCNDKSVDRYSRLSAGGLWSCHCEYEIDDQTGSDKANPEAGETQL